MKIDILDSMTFGADIDLSRFREIGEVKIYEQSTAQQAAERLEADDPDVVIVNKVLMNQDTLQNAPGVKMIAVTATGYNNIDLKYAGSRGIRVANAAGYSTSSVVQHTFALLFYVMEKLHYYDAYVKEGSYAKSPCFTHFDKVFPEMNGKTWGIIGLGAIGRGVARVAEAFGCRVIYYSASGHSYDVPWEQADFDTLLRESDVISVHAPLNAFTEKLMNYKAFCKMKPTAYFLNLGRGPIVDEAGLAQALEEKQIAGAGLDVLTTEPITAENPLNRIKDSSTLIITPHIAWATFEARSRLMQEVYLNIDAWRKGKERNVIL